ncbi:molybdopterin-dependent oxidoreductase [Thermodesulfobacteriota bacterium]
MAIELLKGPWRWQEGEYTVTRTIPWSGPGCHNQCGILVYSKDNQVVKVEGDPETPFNEGRLCPRCLSLPKVVHSPYRLKHPLKRAGERGEGKWQKITWNDAYDIVEENVRRIQKDSGPESIFTLIGTGRNIHHVACKLTYSAFGSPNIGGAFLSGLSCFFPKLTLMQTTFSGFAVADCSQMFPDRYDNPDWVVPQCIIIWGNDPVVSNPDSFMGYWVVECMKRGSKLIVIDPRLTWMASRADVWLQVRPGTDSAVALGMIHIIIEEDLYDHEFIEKWTDGFEELRQRATEYTPGRVEEISWVPKDKLIKAARLYARSKPASVQWGVTLEQHRSGMSNLLAIQDLWALTGNVDVPGGNVLNRPQTPYGAVPITGWGYEDVPQALKEKTLGPDVYPLIRANHSDVVLDTLITDKPYPLKMAWVAATNPLACMGNAPRTIYEGMRKLDFIVSQDMFMTPTATALADLVLPVSSLVERDSFRYEYMYGAWWGPMRTVNKIIQVGECKSDEEILLDLGKRLNPESFPWDNVEQMLDWLLKPSGLTFKELREHVIPKYYPFEYKKYEKGLLRPDGKQGFNTPNGKYMLYMRTFQRVGLDPFPDYEEPPESPVSTPELAKEYPLVLTTGARSKVFFHSEHRQVAQLREIHPDPIVEIHPDTAAKHRIIDGDWVWIENRLGRCKQRAKLVTTIDPRVVHAQHGWWYPEKEAAEPYLFGTWDHNINQLLGTGLQAPSGFCAPLKSLICKIYKAVEE